MNPIYDERPDPAQEHKQRVLDDRQIQQDIERRIAAEENDNETSRSQGNRQS